MSTLTADPGFARGQTLGLAVPSGTYYGPFNADGLGVIGARKLFRDENPQTGVLNSNHTVECVAVKNTSGNPLLPGEVVKFKAAALLTEVDAKAVAADVFLGVVDEYLPAAGVPNNEVFWVVVNGPSTVTKTASSVSAGATLGPSSTAGSAAAQGANALLGFALETSATTKSRILVKNVAGY
jgi:hypothetical protein